MGATVACQICNYLAHEKENPRTSIGQEAHKKAKRQLILQKTLQLSHADSATMWGGEYIQSAELILQK